MNTTHLYIVIENESSVENGTVIVSELKQTIENYGIRKVETDLIRLKMVEYPSTDDALLKEAEAIYPQTYIVPSLPTYQIQQQAHTHAIQLERARAKGTQERGFQWINYTCAADKKDLPEYVHSQVIIQYGLGDVELGNGAMIIELHENGWQNIKWSYIPSHTDFVPQPTKVTTETAEAQDIQLFKNCWYNRNPTHHNNADTGEDMFWRTAAMVAMEYASSRSLKDGELKEVAADAWDAAMELVEYENANSFNKHVIEQSKTVPPNKETYLNSLNK